MKLQLLSIFNYKNVLKYIFIMFCFFSCVNLKQSKKKEEKFFKQIQIPSIEHFQKEEKIKIADNFIQKKQTPLQEKKFYNFEIKKNEEDIVKIEDKKIEKSKETKKKKQEKFVEKKDTDRIENPINEKILDNTKEQSFIKNKIFYKADKMHISLKKNKLILEGNGEINYENNLLLAHKIDFDLQKKEIFATFLKKKTKTHKSKKIQLKFLNKEYYSTDLRINLKSEKAKFSNLFTEINSLLFRAKLFKKVSNDDFFVYSSSITTCNLQRPHYELYTEKVKISNYKRIVTGPIFLKFDQIKTIGFFGGFLDWPNRRKGLLFPKYGGNSKKGIYVENIGYYWKCKDLLDFLIKANVFTGGEIQLGIESFYKKRYLMEGNFSYNNVLGLLSNNQNYKYWNFKWDHFTIDGINRNNFIFINLNLKDTVNRFVYKKEEREYQDEEIEYKETYKSVKESSVKYMHKLNFLPFYRFNSKIAYIETITQSLKNLDIVFPSIMLSSTKIYPFKNLTGNIISFLNIEHSVELKNAINIQGYNFSIFNTKDWINLFELKKNGIENIINLSADWHIKYLTVNPYFKTRNYCLFKLKNNKNKYIWDYDTGITLNTNLYGTYILQNNRSILAIRHHLVPSVILNYNSDLSKILRDQDNERFFIFDIPNRDEALSLDVIIDNIFSYKDNDKKKQIFIESLSLKSGYNFFEINNPVKNIELYEKVLLFGQILIFELTQICNPYYKNFIEKTEIENLRKNHKKKLYIIRDKILGRIEESSIKVSAKFNINKGIVEKNEHFTKSSLTSSDEYVDFNIPLTLGFNYLYKYTSLIPFEKKVTSVFFTEFLFSLSKNWELSIETGYDFEKKQIAREQTSLIVKRDLHCWEMDFRCYPIAKNQLFDFSIGVKPSLLDGIKHSRRNKSYKNLF